MYRRIIGRPSATLPVAGVLGIRSSPGEFESAATKYINGFRTVRISRVAERRRFADSEFLAAGVDVADVVHQFIVCLLRDVLVGPRVIADFEAPSIQIRDFLPRHVARFVFEESQSLGDIECGAESNRFEKRRDEVVLRSDAIVESQADKTVRYGLQVHLRSRPAMPCTAP